MLFPFLLVVLFFLTLNFNARVLYAPSDFQTDESFLSALAGRQELSLEFKAIDEQIETVKKEIVNEAVSQVGSISQAERERLNKVIGAQIEALKEKVQAVSESVEDYAIGLAARSYPRSELQARIIESLSKQPDGATVTQIAADTGHTTISVTRALEKLQRRGVLEGQNGGQKLKFKLKEPPF